MDTSSLIREFLMDRRAKIQPRDVGLPDSGRRRVQGLRREELALLAGVSVEYYVQIERGRLAGVSDEVLSSIARALRLDTVEQNYLFHLFRGNNSSQPDPPQNALPQGIQTLLTAMSTVPALLENHRLDVLHANALAQSIFEVILETPTPNLARFVFLDPRATVFFSHWEEIADSAVAILRFNSGRFTHDQALSTLIAELSDRSAEFSHRWEQQDVTAHFRGIKLLNHSQLGELELQFESLLIPGFDELSIVSYVAAPGSTSERALLSLTG